MYPKTDRDDASSPVIATVLLIALVTILAALVLLISMNFQIPDYTPPEKIPTIFKINKISSSEPDYDSRIILFNIGTDSYDNSLLKADIYSNDVLLGCRINTMRGYDFIPTHHFFVQTMGGMGCSNLYWNPNEKTSLDLSNGLIKPGDIVQVDILLKPDDKLISTDTYVM